MDNKETLIDEMIQQGVVNPNTAGGLTHMNSRRSEADQSYYEYCCQRCDSIRKNDKELGEISERIVSIQKELKSRLPADLWKLIIELSNLSSEDAARAESLIYAGAIKDFCSITGIVGCSVTQPACIFCGDVRGVADYRGKNICLECMKELKK